MDFTTTTWMTSFVKRQTIIRTVDEYTFTIVYDGKTVTINEYPVTVEDWETVLSGKPVTLKSNQGTIKLTYKKPNVLFDGHSFYGSSVTVETKISSEPINPGSGNN